MYAQDVSDNFVKICDETVKLTERKFDELDTEFLVDLLMERINDFRDSVIEWTGNIISHRYKIQNIPEEKAYLFVPQWKITVNKTVGNILRKFRRSPSLRKWALMHWDEVWEYAMDDYKDAQLKYSDLPDITDKECPWNLDELLVRYES